MPSCPHRDRLATPGAVRNRGAPRLPSTVERKLTEPKVDSSAEGAYARVRAVGIVSALEPRPRSTCIPGSHMIGVELFAGAGGLSLGARQAGVKVRLAVELSPFAAETYRKNHPGTLLIEQDIRTLAQLPSFRRHKEQHPVVVFGGPPCQGFSTSNQRTRNDANPSNWLFREFFRIVEMISPDFVVFENVKGLLETAGGMFLEQIENCLVKLGYKFDCGVLNAEDFGVPQRRGRFFLLASRDRLAKLPVPAKRKTITVNEALMGLPKLTNGASISRLPYVEVEKLSPYAKSMRCNLPYCENHLVTHNAAYVVERYPHIKAGGNWKDIPPDLMGTYANPARCHTGIYRRLDGSQPSAVIGNFRKNMLIHPNEDRGLSVREAARLQSFPDSYTFHGTIGKQQLQVGNAVPPILARHVFSQLMQII